VTPDLRPVAVKFYESAAMPKAEPMDYSKDMKDNPEISQLLRVILQSDPFVVAEGNSGGVPYVIMGGAIASLLLPKPIPATHWLKPSS
jgi:hypothetical protein